jgi:hypothetical protein
MTTEIAINHPVVAPVGVVTDEHGADRRRQSAPRSVLPAVRSDQGVQVGEAALRAVQGCGADVRDERDLFRRIDATDSDLKIKLDGDVAQKVTCPVVVDRLYRMGEDCVGIALVGARLRVAVVVGLGRSGEDGVQVAGHVFTPVGEGRGVGFGCVSAVVTNGQTTAYNNAATTASNTPSRSTVMRVRTVSSPSPTACA